MLEKQLLFVYKSVEAIDVAKTQFKLLSTFGPNSAVKSEHVWFMMEPLITGIFEQHHTRTLLSPTLFSYFYLTLELFLFFF